MGIIDGPYYIKHGRKRKIHQIDISKYRDDGGKSLGTDIIVHLENNKHENEPHIILHYNSDDGYTTLWLSPDEIELMYKLYNKQRVKEIVLLHDI